MDLTPYVPPWAQAIPGWLLLAALAVLVLLAVALVITPFTIMGLRGRIDLIEAQLDDIHAELRLIAMGLPDPPAASSRPRRVVVEPERPQPESRSEPRLRWPE